MARLIHGLTPTLHCTELWAYSKNSRPGLQKTHSKLAHEIKRIISRSPKLDAATLDELETALIAADLGMAVTRQIVGAVKEALRNPGRRRAGCLRHRHARKWRRAWLRTTAALQRGAGRLDGGVHRRRQWHRQDHDRGKTGVAGSVAKEDRAARGVRHVPRRRHRTAQTLGPAPGSGGHCRRLRRGCGGGRPRRHHRRAGAQGGLPVHRHRGPPAHQAQPDAGIAEAPPRHRQAAARARRTKSCWCSTRRPA